MLLRSIRSRLIGLVVASVVPFTALIGVGSLESMAHRPGDRHSARHRRGAPDRRQVDDHISNLKICCPALSVAVSWDPQDTDANDRLLRRVKAELPPYFANLLLFSLDGTNIGTSSGPGRFFAGDRDYFEQILAGQHACRQRGHSFARRQRMGRHLRASGRRRRRPAARRARRRHAARALPGCAEHRASFRPAAWSGSSTKTCVVIAHSADGPNWIGRDLSRLRRGRPALSPARDLSEVVRWADGVERITGSARADQVPWMVSVGLPADAAFATVDVAAGRGFELHAWWRCCPPSASPGCCPAGSCVRCGSSADDASALAAGDLSHRTQVAGQWRSRACSRRRSTRWPPRSQQREEDASRAADDLKQAKDTLSAVIDASPVAIVCSDLDRRIFLWNRAAERIFGYTAEEAIGRQARDMPPPVDPRSVGLVERALARRDRARPAPQAAAQGRHRCRRARRGGGHVQCRRHASAASRAPTKTSPIRCAPRSSSSASRTTTSSPAFPTASPCRRSSGRLLSGDGDPDRDRPVRSRRLQGRQRYARPFDRRPAPDRGRPAPGRGRGRPRPGLPSRRRRVHRDHARMRQSAGRGRDWSTRCSSGWPSRSPSAITSCMSAAAPASRSRPTTARASTS